MNAWVFLLLPSTLGVDFGWERQPDNSIEYIVQIEPEAVDEMKTGTELLSTLPPSVRNTIRNYRIRVGRDRLPNQNTLPPEASATTGTTYPAGAAWGNQTQPSYLPSNATASTYPLNPGNAAPNIGTPSNTSSTAYPPSSTGGFVNSSLPQPNRPASTYPTAQLPGTSPYGTGTTATTSGGLSTSGFPMQPNSAAPAGTYPPTSGMTTYPNNNYPPNTTYPQNQPSYNTAGQPQYAGQQYPPSGYQPPNYAPNYNQPGYAQNGYNQPQYGQPGYPQYVAANPNDPNAWGQGPRLGDPGSYGMQTAKPSIEMPAPTGTAGYGPQPYAGPNGSTFPQNQTQPAGSPFVNTADPRYTATAGTDPKSSSDARMQTTTSAAADKAGESQWVSLTFALIALFASLGANFYLGWSTYHLRERYRMMLADRTTY